MREDLAYRSTDAIRKDVHAAVNEVNVRDETGLQRLARSRAYCGQSSRRL